MAPVVDTISKHHRPGCFLRNPVRFRGNDGGQLPEAAAPLRRLDARRGARALLRLHSGSAREDCRPAPFGKITGKCPEDAGVEIGNRHHGPHALRHSPASNMLESDAPVHDISNVLGHSRTQTTAMYLSVDAKHMHELALEVPHAVSR